MHFQSIEELMADESFLAWYFKTDEQLAKEWEKRLQENPGLAPMAEEAAKWLGNTTLRELPPAAAQMEAALQRIQRSVEVAPVVEMPPRKRSWWIPAAAAVLVLVIAGFVFWNSRPAKKSLETAYGTIREYRLPDGSSVTLNANSELTLQEEWKSGRDREVWLKGEAFFRIEKTSTRDRFIVHTPTMDIIVTGTQFNAVSREDEASVLLTEGSVTVRTKNGRELRLQPGDFVRIENELPAKQEVDQQRILAWKQNKLNFERTPMTEVSKIISRHYGVRVTLDPALSNKTISGILPNDNLDVLIRALEATGDYRITRTDKEITISAP